MRPERRVEIGPPERFAGPGLADLWAHRELILFLAWRDVVVRYKQAVLGVAWTVFKPLGAMLVYTLLLGKVAHLPSDGAPYSLLVLTGLLPWQLFSGTLQHATASLTANGALLTRVYFPRLVLPLSSALPQFLDFAISCLALGGVMIWYGWAPPWTVVFLPAIALLIVPAALSVGLWLAALNVQYRDVTKAVPYLVGLLMWMSPVVYSAGIVPEGWTRTLYQSNPIATLIITCRWAVLGHPPPDAGAIWVSATLVIVMLVGGLLYFRSREHYFADLV